MLAECWIFPDFIVFGFENCTVSQEAALEASDNDFQHLERNTVCIVAVVFYVLLSYVYLLYYVGIAVF